jgi:hypothetical protein
MVKERPAQRLDGAFPQSAEIADAVASDQDRQPALDADVGVSGVQSHEDEQVAQAAIEAFLKSARLHPDRIAARN